MAGMKIIACLAASLDGKIATRDVLENPESEIRIGSQHDLEHLLRVRTEADAVLMGAGTFRAYGNPRRDANQRAVPLHVIVTRSGHLNPQASLFKADLAIATIVFSPAAVSSETRRQYPPSVEWVATGDNPVAMIVNTLSARGVQTLLIEGGGEMLDLFLRARALDELVLTICPLLLGGRDVPGLLTGAGFYIHEAPRVSIRTLEQVENELYLRLGLTYSQG